MLLLLLSKARANHKALARDLACKPLDWTGDLVDLAMQRDYLVDNICIMSTRADLKTTTPEQRAALSVMRGRPY